MIKNNKPLFSVIVPCWNEQKYLPRLIPRLLNQTYPNYEVIVVDNNSTDESVKIARSYGVRVVHEHKQGLSYARNRGFKEAKGEFLLRTDADTMPDRDWINNFYEGFLKHPEAVAITGSSEFYDGGRFLELISKQIFIFVIYLTKLSMGHMPLNGPNFALRKYATKNIKTHNNDSLFHEDMDLSCHIVKYGRIVFDPKIIMKTSARRLFNNPYFILKYFMKSVRTYLIHHPSHRLHNIK